MAATAAAVIAALCAFLAIQVPVGNEVYRFVSSRDADHAILIFEITPEARRIWERKAGTCWGTSFVDITEDFPVNLLPNKCIIDDTYARTNRGASIYVISHDGRVFNRKAPGHWESMNTGLPDLSTEFVLSTYKPKRLMRASAYDYGIVELDLRQM